MPIFTQAREARIGIAFPSSQFIASTARLNDRYAGCLTSPHILKRRAKIPIERAAPARTHPAGSFPEGFRTTAPVLGDGLVMGPSSETLHKSRLPRCKKVAEVGPPPIQRVPMRP